MAAPAVERTLVLWLTNASHAANHFQNQMVSTLYPVIMAELGLDYFQLGTLTAIRVVFGNASQIVYGFLTPFVRRSHLLGVANVVMGLGNLFTGLVGGYSTFVVARRVTSIVRSTVPPWPSPSVIVKCSTLVSPFARYSTLASGTL